MPQKRKRKRTRIKPGPILALAVIVVFVTGILYSPLTSLSKVSVIGARPEDQARIQEVLGSLNRTPWIMAFSKDIQRVESEVQQIEAIDHASYSQNIFGRGRLEVSYRVPVASVRSGTPIGLDASGVMFETNQLPPDLPQVVRPQSAKDLPLTTMGGFPAVDVANLAVRARQMAPQEKLIIWFNEKGALCLSVGSGLVVFGSSDDLDAKLRALKDILDEQPGLLAKIESLNLTEPSHPAKTYKKQRQ